MPETVLVTGGAGFIGSHLVDGLVDAGHRVKVLDNLEPQVHGGLREAGLPPQYLNPEAEFILGDICDFEVVSRALEGVDVLFHEAALVGVGQSMYDIERYTSVNTGGAAVLLQALINARHRPRKVIVASSMSIYGEGAYECPIHGRVFPHLRSTSQLQRRDWELYCPVNGCGERLSSVPTPESKSLHPSSIYAITKRDHEEMFLTIGHAYTIPTVALRYFNTYGTRQALSNPYTGVAAIFSSRLLNGKPPVIFEDGWQRRDFIHVSDIVQANLLVMNEPNADFGTFNVGTGSYLSIQQVAEILIQHFSDIDLNSAFDGQKSKYLDLKPEITHQFRAGDIRHCYSDISHLSALGFQPRVRFEEGIAELLEWVRLQSASDRFDASRLELEQRGLAN
jgi:dTDP-L-rhamnose 4-epimerase